MASLTACSQLMTSQTGRMSAPRVRNLVRRRSAVRSSNSSCLCRWMSSPASSLKANSLFSGHQIPAANLSLKDFTRMSQQQREERMFSSLASPPTPSSSNVSTPSNNISPLDDPATLAELGGINKHELLALASQHPTPLRLGDMYKYGFGTDLAQRLRNAQFLHKELQIRIAQRAVDLLTLPHGLSEATPIRHVASMYLGYLLKFQQIPSPVNTAQEDAFTDMLQGLVLDRTTIPMDIARGVVAWRDEINAGRENLELERLQEMEDALYRFFTARVGLRFVTEHHVLSSPRESTRALRNVTHMFPPDEQDAVLGCIQTNCDLVKEVTKVSALVSEQTREYYGMCPQIKIVDAMRQDLSREFTYVPHHLHYMLGELLKNACRATVRRTLDQEMHGNGSSTATKKEELPPIRVIIVKGEEDVTIKIADTGGGIPRSAINTIWKFAHSTADEDESNTDFGMIEVSGARIRGFGLPLARIYARYFGGELTLKSTEGYGLDAYLHLPRLGDSCEHLPLRVRTSPGARISLPTGNVRRFSTAVAAPSARANRSIRHERGDQRHDMSADERNVRRILNNLHSRAL
jgi:pyruvate dehydrogenase kinase 2/3/4